MSLSFGKSNSKQKSTLDPQLSSTLYGNVSRAQNLADTTKYHALDPSQIAAYQNPYENSVIDSLKGDYQQTAAQSQNRVDDAALAAHAFGGSRHGVQAGVTEAQGQKDLAGIIANLRAQGYNTATQTAQTENTNANNLPLLLQQMLNGTIGLIPQTGTTKTSGTTMGASYTYGGK